MDKFLWWQTGVIYQIYPRSFMDSNGDGLGDIQGVIDRLDYLEMLGIKAIWFSPLFPSPMADFGYDVSDYRDIHSEYGTLADFDKLLVAAHQREMKIILDLVPNHTSDEHPWFVESRSSKDNPKRDWYIWRDPAPDGGPPNNWMSYFEGPAWTLDNATGQYYLHNFHPKQPDLNWRNPETAEAMLDHIRFWLKRGVDGFRIDVIDRILKHPDLPDNPPNPTWQPGDSPLWQFERVYSERQFPEIFTYMKQFRAVFDEFPERVAIGELAYNVALDHMAAYYGDESLTDDNTGDGLHLPFNFGLIIQDWNAESIKAYVDAYDAALPAYAWPNYVLGNHDQPRIASKYGPEQARIAAMLLLTLRGTPTLYYGDEIGMTNTPIPRDRIKDPQGIGGGFNRDEARTPMQWDANPHAGFTNADTPPWLPVHPDFETVNVAAQRDEPAAMLSYYYRLLTYRRQTPALHQGRYYPVEVEEPGCFVYLRQYNDQRCLIALNFTDETHTLSLPDYANGNVIVSTNSDRDGLPIDLNTLTLTANEGLLIEL